MNNLKTLLIIIVHNLFEKSYLGNEHAYSHAIR